MPDPTFLTPAITASRLKTSISVVEELRTELTALGLDPDYHQPTPFQNRLLAAADAILEGWLEIQREKHQKAEAQALRVPPEVEYEVSS